MRILPLSLALDTYWEDLVYLEAALLADPSTRDLAALVTKHLRDLDAVQGLDRESRRALLQARARAAVADLGLDQVIRGLHSGTLHQVQQNRKAPLFRAVFESDLAGTIRFALARQVEVAADLADRLGLGIVPAALRDAHLPGLQAAVEHGKAVLAGRRQAELSRTDVRLTAQDWKQSANGVRQAVYGKLVALAAERQAGRDWAEAFFASDEDAAPTPAVVPVPQPEPEPTPVPA